MEDHRWSIAAIDGNNGDRAVAYLADGSLAEIEALPEAMSPIEIMRQWETLGPVLRNWSPGGAKPVQGTLVAPLRYPRKLLCVGANYSDHRTEMETADPAGVKPFFLQKPPTTAIIGPDEAILVRGDPDRVDWEVEVAVVIGKPGRFIAREDAYDHIAGYVLANDVSARGSFERQNPIHAAFAYDWLSSKGQDTFCPIGPAILPTWFIDDPEAIPFGLKVNGVVEQSGNTGNLIASIRDLIVAASQLVTLEPGDLIATGTPGGVGAAKGRFLCDGDLVELFSPLIGSSSNPVRYIGEGGEAAIPVAARAR